MFYKLLAIFICIIPAFANADIFKDMSESLRYMNQRQSVISQNLANADTPGYKAKKLQPMDSRGSSISLVTTSPKHISGNRYKGPARVVEDPNTRYETIDGNTVVIEDQMLKMNQNTLDYRATLGVMRKMSGLVRSAVSSGK